MQKLRTTVVFLKYYATELRQSLFIVKFIGTRNSYGKVALLKFLNLKL